MLCFDVSMNSYWKQFVSFILTSGMQNAHIVEFIKQTTGNFFLWKTVAISDTIFCMSTQSDK
ncbi:hypothetical protein DICVIV_10331 [Dictyocaulus viviparus]|uniref:Uncharacterized protein n=1 Tax=Dictyocaulus viviparus TaxID=29172 RepID=A0A0D8XIR0_DICVI|nr:hypothetical protein DICVIV_10331 [Dictyocaulus viviparus]